MAGILAGGAYCANTLSEETEDLTLTEFIAFLEPDETTGKGAAYCTSVNDFSNLQIALEQACRKLGNACTKEIKAQIETVSERIALLSERASKKPVPVSTF